MIGNFPTASVVDCYFSTRSNGAMTTLAGTPAVSVYKNNSTTESTSGVTLDVDFDSRTGMNHVRVDTSSDGTFYAASGDYSIVITAGTVGGVSVVGIQIDSFSLSNRSVNATQLAGQTITAAAGVTFPSSVASPTNITAGTIATVTTVTNLTNAPTAGDLTATMKASVTAAVPTAAATADKLLGRNIAGGADGGRTLTSALRMIRNKVVFTPIDATTGTFDVYDETDGSIAFSGTYIRAAADALQTVDPT